MSGWETTILVAGWSRRKDRDLSFGTEMTREVALSLTMASAKAGAAVVVTPRSTTAAQRALARLRGMVWDSGYITTGGRRRRGARRSPSLRPAQAPAGAPADRPGAWAWARAACPFRRRRLRRWRSGSGPEPRPGRTDPGARRGTPAGL